MSDRLIATARNNLEKGGIVPTQLCCRTREAEQINETKLAELQGKLNFFLIINTLRTLVWVTVPVYS